MNRLAGTALRGGAVAGIPAGLAALGPRVLAGTAVVVLIVVMAVCWTITDAGRSERLAMLIRAGRGVAGQPPGRGMAGQPPGAGGTGQAPAVPAGVCRWHVGRRAARYPAGVTQPARSLARWRRRLGPACACEDTNDSPRGDRHVPWLAR
jgi:hypothetical protein